MEIPLFLAMTAGEVQGQQVLPRPLAWMACHFSCYGTGLSNLPRELPAGSMLMLNDRTPVCGHDPDLVAQRLWDTAQRLDCDSILLDFQRPDCNETPAIIEAILAAPPCPVGVSSLYAQGFHCPVLVPPVPPHIPLDDTLSPWKGRELWLEISTEGTEITVTTEGSHYAPLPFYTPPENAHREPELHCHYEITVSETEIRFRLGRTEADLEGLLSAAKSYGVTKGVGLWLELTGMAER